MTLRQSDAEVRLEKSKTRRGVGRRELKKRGRAINGNLKSLDQNQHYNNLKIR